MSNVKSESLISMEDMEAMLKAKTQELLDVRNELLQVQNKLRSTEIKALAVHEKNQLMAASPELAIKMAEMDLHLRMADKFVKSGAFPKMTPEQAFTVMKAGKEMGMTEVESINALYIVNGSIKFYGDKMVARLTKKGYRIEYLEESENGVTVRVYHKEEEFDVSEKVTKNDQILKRSKAMGFSQKNKMRFHGVRIIATFHLPHLFGSVTDEFTSDYVEYREEKRSELTIPAVEARKQRERVLSHIKEAVDKKDLEMLEMVREHRVEMDVVEEFDAAFVLITGQKKKEVVDV